MDMECDWHKLEQINEAALTILDTVGIRILSESHRAFLAEKGVRIQARRAFFSPDETREMIAKAPASFTLHGIDPVKTIDIGTGKSKIAAAYGCSRIMEPGGTVRATNLADHAKLVKLVHQSDALHLNGGILAQPNDVDSDKSHLAMHYTTLIHSDKCIMGIGCNKNRMEDIMLLSAIRLGGNDALRRTPRVMTMVASFSPLQVDVMALEAIETAAKYNQPVMCSPGVATGTTGPIDLASNLAMATAEALAMIVITQLYNPGNPVIFGLQCYGADMVTGNISIGSPAYALQAKYTAALARFYDLPSRCGGATNDAKSLSPQAGYESMLSIFTAMQNQTSLIVHGAGILDSFACISIEKFIMDLEMIKMSRFYLDDIQIDEDSLNVDQIRQVGPGGLFLTNPDTLKKCRTHSWIPKVALRGGLMGMDPGSRFMQKIAAEQNRMLSAYEAPEIDSEIVKEMNRFMTRKGLDPDTLPLKPKQT